MTSTYYHEGTEPDGQDYSIPCPLQASSAMGLCTRCGFERSDNNEIEDFINLEMEQATLIIMADPFLRTRFFNNSVGIGALGEILANGAYDRPEDESPNLDGLSQWTSMRICCLYQLTNESETYVMANQTPIEGLLEYLMACVLVCNRMIEHHTH